MRRDLVERAMAGDHDAFSELARVSIGRLYAAARLILRDDAARRGRDPGGPRGRLARPLGPARSRSLRGLAASAPRPGVLSRSTPGTTAMGDRDARSGRRERPSPTSAIDLADRDELERGFARLDADQRTVLVLHHYLGLTLDEVADALGRPARHGPLAAPSRHAGDARRARRGRSRATIHQRRAAGMTARDDFDRLLAAWLHGDAPTASPSTCSAQVLARTARTRRRPAWRIPERWIPMSAITSRLAPDRPSRGGPSASLALLVLALVVGALIWAGAAVEAAPPRSGWRRTAASSTRSTATSVGADVPSSGRPRSWPRRPTTDPTVSLDGTAVRVPAGDRRRRGELWIAGVDGSQPAAARRPVHASTTGRMVARTSPVAVSRRTARRSITLVRPTARARRVSRPGLPVGSTRRSARPTATRCRSGAGTPTGTGASTSSTATAPAWSTSSSTPGFADDPATRSTATTTSWPRLVADGTALVYHTLEPAPSPTPAPASGSIWRRSMPTGVVSPERTLEFDAAQRRRVRRGVAPGGDGHRVPAARGRNRTVLDRVDRLDGAGRPRPRRRSATDCSRRPSRPDGQRRDRSRIPDAHAVGGRASTDRDLDRSTSAIVERHPLSVSRGSPGSGRRRRPLRRLARRPAHRWGLERSRSRPHSSQNASQRRAARRASAARRRSAAGSRRRRRRSAGAPGRGRGAPRPSGRGARRPATSPASRRRRAPPTRRPSPGSSSIGRRRASTARGATSRPSRGGPGSRPTSRRRGRASRGSTVAARPISRGRRRRRR